MSFSFTSAQYRFYHYDANGNCILLTDLSGNIQEQYEYDAFGKPYYFTGYGAQLGASNEGNRFLFTGREWLSELGLYDYRARLYQPELGRFLQPDPKEFEAGDYNLYRYCHNDPVNRSDPFGLFEFAISPDYPHDSVTTPGGREALSVAIKLFEGTERGAQLKAMDPNRVITIKPISANGLTGGEGNTIHLNPKDNLLLDKQSRSDFARHRNELPPENDKGRATILGHEVGHRLTPGKEGRDEDKPGGKNVQKNENPVRDGLGIVRRLTYGGHRVEQ